MSTEGTDDEAAAQVDAEEPIEVEDLLEDPRTDAEALAWREAISAFDAEILTGGLFSRHRVRHRCGRPEIRHRGQSPIDAEEPSHARTHRRRQRRRCDLR